MKRLFLVVGLWALAQNFVLAKDRDGKIKASLECPVAGVLGFPILVTMTVRNMSTVAPYSMLRMDLATETDGWYAKGLTIQFTAADGATFFIGTSLTGRPDVEFADSPPRVWIKPKEHITETFDLNQLLLRWGEGRKLPVAGEYRVRLLCYDDNAVSEQRNMTLRDPSDAEQHYLAALAKQGVKEQWFPSIIRRENLELPPSGGLPVETVLLCDYISVLRLAVRNPAAALVAFAARSNWGGYADSVRELEYECTIAVHGKDSEQATGKRADLTAAGLSGCLTRLDNDGGLLPRFGTTGQSE